MAQIARAYFTNEELRASIGQGAPDDDLIGARVAVAVSRFFDKVTGQFFGRDEAAVARYFTGDGSPCLRLVGDRDGCPGIADTTGMSVALDTNLNGTYATSFSTGQYEAIGWDEDDLNPDKGPEPRPFRMLHIPRWSSAGYLTWPCDMRVRVTAIYGWPSVPEPVWADCIELAGIWMGKNPRATGNMNELETVVATSPMAMSLVRRIQRAYSLAVAA